MNHGDFGSNATATAYDMRNMYDETDRIKSRMREFEERCKRWREEFFNKSTISHHHPHPLHHTHHINDPFVDDFDQRVPFGGNGDFAAAATSPTLSRPMFSHSPPPPPPPPPVSSSMPFASTPHRSYVEDAADGSGLKLYKVEFDIGDFRQNELMITTNGQMLAVKGDRELKAGSATETKTFNREINLPDYVDADKMNAYLLDNNNNNNNSPQAQTNGGGDHVSVKINKNNVLVIEAPVIADKYSYRRSIYDQSPTRSSAPQSTRAKRDPSAAAAAAPATTSESTYQKTSSSTSKSTVESSKIVQHELARDSDEQQQLKHRNHYNNTSDFVSSSSSSAVAAAKSPIRSSYTSPSHLNLNAAAAAAQPAAGIVASPELIAGYPVYDKNDGCVIYKFDLSGFDQSEIHLTITVDRTMEIKACKEQTDHLGKVYREFKREIQLEPETDANLIKNVLQDGVLTLKIPKANRADGAGSLRNAHSLHDPNGFREVYNDEGKLAKLTSDFKGFAPDNLKIVLSANNVLKISAQQTEAAAPVANAGAATSTVQKECTRQYALPAWIQPEQMRAVLSRDGILTVDFTGNANGAAAAAAVSASSSTSAVKSSASSSSSAHSSSNSNSHSHAAVYDERIHINWKRKRVREREVTASITFVFTQDRLSNTLD